MVHRTTIEIYRELLERARSALGLRTTRATVEEALRRVAGTAEVGFSDRADRQRQYFATLGDRADVEVMASDSMWR